MYYFAAATRLRSERFWWMRERSVYTCEAILLRLGDRCEECTSWARALVSKEEDLEWHQRALQGREVNGDDIPDITSTDTHRFRYVSTREYQA